MCHGKIHGDAMDLGLAAGWFSCRPRSAPQVLEAREEVEETDDPKRLHALLSANRERQQALVAQLSRAFAGGDLRAAGGLTTQLTYLFKLEQEIVNKAPSL